MLIGALEVPMSGDRQRLDTKGSDLERQGVVGRDVNA